VEAVRLRLLFIELRKLDVAAMEDAKKILPIGYINRRITREND